MYTFKDVSIPPNVKTVKISYIENKARYVNPQLSSRLTDALQQKISSNTKLTRTTNDDANYQISGTITTYNVSTSGITTQNGTTQTATNRLTVGVHINFVNNMPNATQNKSREFDVSRDFDFASTLTLTQAESSLLPQIIKDVSDEIFNQIFSNW
ncbi:MAG: LptE family protein [Chitinophagaceae bacterium]